MIQINPMLLRLRNGPKPSVSGQPKSWFTLENANDDDEPVKVWLHGDIGAYDIESIDLIQALQSIGGDQDVQLRVQSYGGSVYEGLALYNAIKAHKGKTIGIVDGVAASIASYILMACDEVQMPDNAKLMIHMPTMGAWGGEAEMTNALTQLQNAKTTIAEAYVAKSGQSLEDVLSAMQSETWFTAQQAKDWGMIDAVVDPINLSNCLNNLSREPLNHFKHPPQDWLASNVTPTPLPKRTAPNSPIDPEPEPIPLAARAQPTPNEPEQDNEMTPEELKAMRQNEADRQKAIRALCNQHRVGDELMNTMLDDVDCTQERAAQQILANLGNGSATGQDPAQPAQLNNAVIHADNGHLSKDMLQNALNARCGIGDLEKDNPYAYNSLLDMAKASVGKSAAGLSKSELVNRAFNTQDFQEIITEGVRTVMRDETKIKAPLWRGIANTENLPDFKETDLVMVNEAPDLMKVSEDGEYKEALINGTGEKIQLATYGREIRFTRQAIINDDIALINKVPRKFTQAAYRLSDKLMFNAILAGQLGDGKDIFLAPTDTVWGNLYTGITAGDYSALIMALHKSFATAMTKDGQDALDLRGEVLLASPDHASMLEAVLNTASKPDTFNPAYKKFDRVVETARVKTINGAIALTGKDFDSVVMGFLDGRQDPWLETDDGWSSDGARFRITYDISSKVIDRRGLAKATFAAK
ncbi:ClpP-like prohead protease/major capsid protein fusion protein [Celerinatantimonas sp. MCCC 1A17872]|uniref:ClpP-like prohead protease/major capsid protein fusion protein n=1 Tax=Celerinatantimonas sp. MCCC 1A17872 TaxID=3177514 RepID=UPI0038C1CAC6